MTPQLSLGALASFSFVLHMVLTGGEVGLQPEHEVLHQQVDAGLLGGPWLQ